MSLSRISRLHSFAMLRLLLVLFPALLLEACSAAVPLAEPPPIRYEAEDSLARRAIIEGMAERHWVVQGEGDGEILASLSLRRHEVKVKLRFGSGLIRFEYADSALMNYSLRGGQAYIHRKYCTWTNNLRSDIVQHLDLLLAGP